MLIVCVVASFALGALLVALGATVGGVPVVSLLEAMPAQAGLAAGVLVLGLGFMCGLRCRNAVHKGGSWGRIVSRATLWTYVLGLVLSVVLQLLYVQLFTAASESRVIAVPVDLPIPQPGFLVSDWLAVLGLLLGPVGTGWAWHQSRR